MKLLITRPVVITCINGMRAFVPGLTVDVDTPTAEQILTQQAGIVAEPAAEAEPTILPRRRKPTDADA